MNEPGMKEIKSLPLPERIQVVEDIWDSIANDADGIPLTEAQMLELDRRLEMYHLDPKAGSTWIEVRDQPGPTTTLKQPVTRN